MQHRGLSGQPCGTDEEATDEDCRTATDWPKCFCIYRLKCSKAINGWLVGWISHSTYSKSTCGAYKDRYRV